MSNTTTNPKISMTVAEMLSDLDKHYKGQLTEWQELFVASMITNMETFDENDMPHTFTVNQVNKVKEIYAEKDEEL